MFLYILSYYLNQKQRKGHPIISSSLSYMNFQFIFQIIEEHEEADPLTSLAPLACISCHTDADIRTVACSSIIASTAT